MSNKVTVATTKKDEILCQAVVVVISKKGKTPPDLESEKQLLYSFDGLYKAKVTLGGGVTYVHCHMGSILSRQRAENQRFV